MMRILFVVLVSSLSVSVSSFITTTATTTTKTTSTFYYRPNSYQVAVVGHRQHHQRFLRCGRATTTTAASAIKCSDKTHDHLVDGTTTEPTAVAIDDDDDVLLMANTIVKATNKKNHHHQKGTSRNNVHHADVMVSMTSLVINAFVVANCVPLVAYAAGAGPDWGIFEGRTASLLHPIAMFSLLAYSVMTAILGFQWRRQRTMGDEIATLKAQLPPSAASTATSTSSSTTTDPPSLSPPDSSAVLALQTQIDALQKERKELANANPRDKHFNQGALLAFIGTAFAIEGPLNTYARAGKLFPGPHLYAGAGLVVCWALATACVPYMQKGNESARIVHIGANFAGLALFTWQVVSGVPILFKVIEFTKWP